jgi:hypothetical protein
VRGPGPITWDEARLTLQLLVEERIGAPMRQHARRMRAQEDAAFAGLIESSSTERLS